jgi:hypothetical protein
VPETADGSDDELDDRAGEAMAHLQRAAREMIAAARVLLDVAEELVDDPKAGEALLGSLGDVTRRMSGHRAPSTDEDGVEHIRVD